MPSDDLDALQVQLHAQVRSKGFWDHATNNPSIIQEKLMLIVGELGEASEELRKDGDVNYTYYREDGKPEGFQFELADALIRLLDLAEWCGISMADAVEKKDAYNRTRPFMHGKLA